MKEARFKGTLLSDPIDRKEILPKAELPSDWTDQCDQETGMGLPQDEKRNTIHYTWILSPDVSCWHLCPRHPCPKSLGFAPQETPGVSFPKEGSALSCPFPPFPDSPAEAAVRPSWPAAAPALLAAPRVRGHVAKPARTSNSSLLLWMIQGPSLPPSLSFSLPCPRRSRSPA